MITVTELIVLFIVCAFICICWLCRDMLVLENRKDKLRKDGPTNNEILRDMRKDYLLANCSLTDTAADNAYNAYKVYKTLIREQK